MDVTNIQIEVDLCLGSLLVHPHQCQHCIAEVNHFGFHSLSCKESKICHHHYSSGLYHLPRCPPGSNRQLSATQIESVQTGLHDAMKEWQVPPGQYAGIVTSCSCCHGFRCVAAMVEEKKEAFTTASPVISFSCSWLWNPWVTLAQSYCPFFLQSCEQ